MTDLAELDAIAQAELVRTGEASPLELVDAAIARAEALNPNLNAIINPMYDLARDNARREVPDGPFRGVPFLMKDLGQEYAGVPHSEATQFLAGYIPKEDFEMVRRYKAAGLVTIGRTNASEFGILPTAEPRLFGATHNPWDLTRTPGGSSGGSAAAVAARIVPAAHGSDAGGSIRVPAACCGIFGMKPTRARTSIGPVYGDIFSGLGIDHVVSISVRDNAALLDATCGAALGDPYVAPPLARPFFDECGADPGRLRIAFMTRTFAGDDIHPQCVAAVRDAAALCERLGHDVVEVESPVDGAATARAFVTLWAAGAAWSIDDYARRTGRKPAPELFEPGTWAFAALGRRRTAADYLLALEDLQQMSRRVARFMVDCDVLLTPTIGEPPLPLGTLDSPPDQPLAGFARSGPFVPFTAIFNATGMPAMSAPLFWTDDGLPIGTQFAARFGDEATLFRLAAQLEAARPWAQRKPPVSA